VKFAPALVGEIVRSAGPSRRNVRMLFKFLVILAGLVACYSVLFHLIMASEGQSHALFDGVYWTLTVMTTLGFGDITFLSLWGRLFSVVVLLSGLVFMLVLLPFTFIEFFYAPWAAAQASARMPRTAPAGMKGHVIFTHYDPIVAALIKRLKQYHYPYLVLVSNPNEALRLLDQGVQVLLGHADDPNTYRSARAAEAALIAATDVDIPNTNATFTARSVAPAVPIIALAKELPSLEILPLAGATEVLRLDAMLGDFLARCVESATSRAHVVAEFGPLLIAEAAAAGTRLVGQTLRDCQLRAETGVTAIGAWERGTFHAATPDLILTAGMVLLLAGSRRQVDEFNEKHGRPAVETAGPVVIVGAGRVGRAVATSLTRHSIPYRVVEREAGRPVAPEVMEVGDAADLKVMRQAGLLKASTVVITSHDDDANIYLTVFCRRIRPNLRVIARATLERNVPTLHRAGADFVMSYTTLAAGVLLHRVTGGDVMMIAEGINAVRVTTPPALAGQTLAQSRLRQLTGCQVVAVQDGSTTHINPPADYILEAGRLLILVGRAEDEQRFFSRYPESLPQRPDLHLSNPNSAQQTTPWRRSMRRFMFGPRQDPRD
jgi:voltage-gated potassium channel